jgi:hypothetical protein
MLAHHLKLKDWYDNHNTLGGYVASCYVDWDIVSTPLYEIIRLLEAYKKIDYLEIEEFATSEVTNNNMQNRFVMEDLSKIKYLTEEILADALMFHPQIIHEPWFDRYRVHPGSGRAVALWLCGFKQFKTIYTHFDEPGFEPPGHTIKLTDWKSLGNELLVTGPSTSFRSSYDVETFTAFPTIHEDIKHTEEKDSIWAPNFTSSKPWQFLVYSEGKQFLNFKKEWRSHSYDMYTDLQHSITQIGRTIFEFKNDKVIRVIRGEETHNIVD